MAGTSHAQWMEHAQSGAAISGARVALLYDAAADQYYLADSTEAGDAEFDFDSTSGQAFISTSAVTPRRIARAGTQSIIY